MESDTRSVTVETANGETLECSVETLLTFDDPEVYGNWERRDIIEGFDWNVYELNSTDENVHVIITDEGSHWNVMCFEEREDVGRYVVAGGLTLWTAVSTAGGFMIDIESHYEVSEEALGRGYE